MPRILVALAVALVSLPVSAAFGPETPVTSSEIVSAATPGARHTPRIASNGQDYLVVWEDSNAGSSAVLAARVAADGTPIDRTAVTIETGAYDPEVVWTGQSYLIVWRKSVTLHARAMTPDGSLGSVHLAMQVPQGYGIFSYVLATNGSNALVVAGNIGIGSLLEPTGERIGQLTVGATASSADTYALASAGDEYLYAATTIDGVVTQQISAAGQAGPTGTLSGLPRAALAIGTDGSRYLVVATGLQGGTRLVSRANEPLGEAQLIFANDSIHAGTNPRVAWRGGEYVLTFARRSGAELNVLRIDQNGGAIGVPTTFAAAAPFDNAALTSDGAGTAASVWVDSEGRVQLGLMDAMSLATSAMFREPKAIAGGATPQRLPSVVSVGDRLIAAWIEIEGSSFELRIAPVGGGEVVTVAATGIPHDSEIGLAFHGQTLWVLWTKGASLMLRRYRSNLESVDAEPRAIALDGEVISALRFSVAAGERSALAAFPGYSGIEAIVFHEAGEELTVTRTLIAAPTFPSHHPAVVWDGEKYAVVFAHDLSDSYWQFPQPVPNEVLLSRVSRDGVVLDATPLVVSRTNVNNIGAVRAVRATDGTVAIAWQDAPGKVFAARFIGTAQPEEIAHGGGTAALGPLLASATGFVLFRHEQGGAVQSQRLDASLRPVGEPDVVPEFERPFLTEAFYDAAMLHQRPHVVYSRRALEAPYGGVPRLFWRAGDAAAVSRRRAIR